MLCRRKPLWMIAIFMDEISLFPTGVFFFRHRCSEREKAMKETCLNRSWQLHEAPLDWGVERLASVKAFGEGWLPCDLPADIHVPLIEAGIIKEPTQADYWLECGWTEQRSWWFLKKFTLSGSEFDKDADITELVLEGLDTEAAVFLNGELVGEHHSVHYPFVRDVKDYLKPGENELAVRLTSGLEKINDEQLSELNWAVCLESANGGLYRGDARRAFVRRPQYTIGWDWGPKVVTCGITGDVKLRSYKNIVIRDVSVVTKETGTTAKLAVEVNVEDLSLIGTKSCALTVQLLDRETLCAESRLSDVLLTSGPNYLETELVVKNPKLWWPAGYGEQPLYTVRVFAACEGREESYPEFRIGIRTVSLDTSVMSGEDRKFQLVVNGLPIFCKGGDWIPNDSIYARVPKEKYQVLLDEAAEANFNMIRIWGGGLYERGYFYDMCDERGILVWQDFMFACATYPDHHEWFRSLVREELDYQTKRLRNYACLALFCGTNECHWIFNETDNPRWKIKIKYNHQYGFSLPNVLAKEAIKMNCPAVPYWNSSPYGGKLPNDDTVGDVHRWHDAYMSKKLDERLDIVSFDNTHSKFVSEYGYVGPSCLETTRQYLDLADGEEVVRGGDVWKMHLNVFERGNIDEGIKKHYHDHPEQLGIDDYILYGGMVHAFALGYSLEALRFRESCFGAIFWMYNDAWGEAGWTIIDYYLRRKIPYYAVKRALMHRKLIIRQIDGEAVVMGMNDTPDSVTFTAEFGYLSFNGKVRETKKVEIALPPHSRQCVLREKMPSADLTRGCIAVIPDNAEILPAVLRTDDPRNLVYEPSPVRVENTEKSGTGYRVTVSAERYVHGVYIPGNGRCSDNYFDLLPGEQRTIEVYDCDAAPEVRQVR